MTYYIQTYPSYLEHFGTKGQKWGIRRYQNEDGSLTAEGRARYAQKAAKNYYKADILKRKQEKTNSWSKYRKLDKKIRKVQEKSDRESSGTKLTNEEIAKGREVIAKKKLLQANIRTVNGAVLGAGNAWLAGAVGAAVLGTTMPVFYGAGAAIGATIAATRSHRKYYSDEVKSYS